MSASIKIMLYSDEGPVPTIVSIASSPAEKARIEWQAIVGTAEHLLRNHRDLLLESQLTALQLFIAAQGQGES